MDIDKASYDHLMGLQEAVKTISDVFLERAREIVRLRDDVEIDTAKFTADGMHYTFGGCTGRGYEGTLEVKLLLNPYWRDTVYFEKFAKDAAMEAWRKRCQEKKNLEEIQIEQAELERLVEKYPELAGRLLQKTEAPS